MFQPQFSINNRILSAIGQIERLYGELQHVRLPDELSQHLKTQCRIALTHYSTAIEGNPLTLDQVSALTLEEKHVGRPRDEKEVANYFALLTQLPRWCKKYKNRLIPNVILEAHQQIEAGIVEGSLLGKFRTAQNAIYAGRQMIYLPPEAKDVPGLVEVLCGWTQTVDLHPILVAGIFHNQFVTIHPFMDGNGRSARALSLYFLVGHHWDFREWVPIDRSYADDRASYYRHLQQDYSHNYYEGRHQTDFTPWLEYYVEGLRRILETTLSDLGRYQKRGILLNARQKKILKQGSHVLITPRAYAVRFGISGRMATRDLQQLTQWGYLRRMGAGRSVQYLVIGTE